ncbi:M10 family metallopeptidase C-terminal domain-containing protein [Geitlerinema calcuttense]|uniref:DUF11 domain-containing protein n=1 Tax=Geitlerinema calcuttense NRMC-F 0142 TaxID=2922238 RepID=A0ABT7M0L2_9CYAN|nr:hypothetical protein [Geitlerinema calcuttense]MDL5057788.1 hypothetical protein [Geitlerinema calcuttense NRMC-F 0142]
MATINGTLGNDLLSGTPQADLIYGLAGNDTIFGLEGNDTLFGNQGNDSIFGNQGNDLIFGGKDNDFIYGGKDNDTIYGNRGNDTLFGNEGDDVIYGGKGNDLIYGGKGNDRLFGDLGDDTLYGDLGSDTMTGGEGRDLFVVGRRATGTTGSPSLANADYITDFTDGEDRIGLQGLTFNQLEITAGTGQFAGSAIVRDTGTGEYLAILQGVNAAQLTAADFLELTPPTPTPTPTPTSPTPIPPVRPPLTPTPTPTPTISADLQITKTDGLTSIAPGGTLTYTIVATNAGPNAVTDAVVVDNFPTQLTNITWTATQTGGATSFDATGTGNINDTGISLPSGATITYLVSATVNPTTPVDTLLNNSATITSASVTDPNTANNTARDNNTRVVAPTAIQAVDDSVSGRLGSTLIIPVLDNDIGPVQLISFSPTANGGTVTRLDGGTPQDQSDDQLQFIPAAAGTFTIDYTVSDGAGGTDTATVTIIVNENTPGQTITAPPGVPSLLLGSTTAPALGAPLDTLQGSTANDTLVSGTGPNVLAGGAGADEFRYTNLASSGADPQNPLLSGDIILDFDPTIDRIRLDFDVAPGVPVAANNVVLNSFAPGNFVLTLNAPNTPPDFLPGQFLINLNNLDPAVTAADIQGALVFGAS